MDINELRKQIDDIDRKLVDLYCRRMDTAREIDGIWAIYLEGPYAMSMWWATFNCLTFP